MRWDFCKQAKFVKSKGNHSLFLKQIFAAHQPVPYRISLVHLKCHFLLDNLWTVIFNENFETVVMQQAWNISSIMAKIEIAKIFLCECDLIWYLLLEIVYLPMNQGKCKVMYCISSYSFCGNYSFLEIQRRNLYEEIRYPKYSNQLGTDYLSLRPKPDFFKLWLPNFIAENFLLSWSLR